MTVPLDIRNDIRSMDADGVSRSEIARRLHVSRNTVSKYADMEDMSPVAPVRRARERPGLEGNGPWIEKVLDEDLSAPRKQRHTAKRIYDRLVEERGGSPAPTRRFAGSWPSSDESARRAPARGSSSSSGHRVIHRVLPRSNST